MSRDRSDTTTTGLAGRWPSSQKALKAVQVAFDTSDEVATRLRLEAVREGLSPSDMIRRIVGLPVRARPVRPRLTVSLSDEDFHILAERYALKPSDRLAIKRRVMEEITGKEESDRA